MMRAIPTLLLLLLSSTVFADGFSSLPLKQVLLNTDSIILVKILENKGTTTHRNKGKGSFEEAVIYSNDIKTKVISTHLGEFTDAEYNTTYKLTLVKGVWLGIPGSGLEGKVAPGETYVLLLRRAGDMYVLQRAEKAEDLEDVLRLKKELDDEDRRVAVPQTKPRKQRFRTAFTTFRTQRRLKTFACKMGRE